MKERLPLKSGIELAAMVDIVFLLVAYFLLHASLTQNAVLEVELPQSQSQESLQGKGDVLSLVIPKEGPWKLNGLAIRPEELKKRLVLAVQKNPSQELRLYGDAKTEYARIVRALDIIQASGLRNLKIITKSQIKKTLQKEGVL